MLTRINSLIAVLELETSDIVPEDHLLAVVNIPKLLDIVLVLYKSDILR